MICLKSKQNITLDILKVMVVCLDYGSRGLPLSTQSVDSIAAISHGKDLKIFLLKVSVPGFDIHNPNLMK
jgi:hypothetical protein